jgi:hypothetical protein
MLTSDLHALLWIMGLAFTGVMLAAGVFLLSHVLRAHARRDDRRDERDLLRPNTEPKR